LIAASIAVKTSTVKNAAPDWFNLKIWGKRGENFHNICKKGSLISIEGELDVESWSDKATGETRSRPIVKVDRWDILSTPQTDDDYSETDYKLPERQANNYSETDNYELPERGHMPQSINKRQATELVDQIPF
jgi:single stranded DNA-binding protein